MPTTAPVATNLNAGAPAPGVNRVAKTKGQLKREERVSIFGLDCADSILISGWQIGKEVQKTITIKNVSLTTQKLNYELPKNEAFQLDYPKGWALAPGTSVTIRLFFRPIIYEPHLDYVTVKTPTGQFSILLKAVVTELALSIPPFVDFGYGAVQEVVVIALPMHNTGSLPLCYEWGCGAPFLMPRNLSGTIPVNGMMEVEIEFHPPQAKTYEGILRVKISAAVGSSSTEGAPELDSAHMPPHTDEAVEDVKFYELRVIGAGKVPHLVAVMPNTSAEQAAGIRRIPPPADNTTTLVDLPPVLPSQSTRVALQIQNVSLVRANYVLRPVQDEIPPLHPCALQYFPESGSIEPGEKGEVEFKFSSAVVGEAVARDFEIVSPGGAPLRVSVTGSCVSPTVDFSAKSLNFGELDCSQDPARVYERAMLKQQGKDPGVKILRLDNRSPLKVHYHFVNSSQLYNVFTFDKPSGTLAPHGYVLIHIYFTPMAPINYYKRFYCVFKNGPLEAVPVDLIGTGYTDAQRPAVLQIDNVTQWHRMRLQGYPEYDSRPNSPTRSDDASPDAPSLAGGVTPFSKGTPGKEEHDGDHGSPVRSVSPKKTYHNFLERVFPATLKRPEISNVQSFLECVYPPKDVCLTPDELDFFGQPGVRTVTVTNNTSQKVIAVWMIVNETRQATSVAKFEELDLATFSVYPNSVEIPARGEMEFQVTYRPGKEMNFDGEVLECYVYPKRNRSFHLVNLKRFTPPTCLNLYCQGHTMGYHRDDCQVEVSDSNNIVRMKPCALMQRSYHVFLIKNCGDTKMVYRILPALGENLGEETPFSCYPKRGCIYPHSFHAIVVEFAPTKIQNEAEFKAKIPIVVNYEETEYRYVHVQGRCWQTKLDVKNLLTFPLTCQGLKSTRALMVRNRTEIPISYDVRIPARFRSVFHVEEAEGQLGPAESSQIALKFTPEAAGQIATAISVYATEKRYADDDKRVFAIQDRNFFGPRAIEDVAGEGDFCVEEPAPHPTARKPYAIQLVGHGQQPALSLETSSVDLGVLTATHPDKTKAEVRLFNNSNQEVRFKLEVQFEFERLELDRSPLRKSIEQMRSPKGSHRDGKSTPLNSPRITDRYSYPPSPQPPKDPLERNEDRAALFRDSLVFEKTEGAVGPRGFVDLKFEVNPKRRGVHQWHIRVVPVAFHHPLPDQSEADLEAHFSVRADAQSPLVQISDVRQESAVSQPVSMLWTYCQVDDFNQGQRLRPSAVDRKFQSALGFDARRKLLPQLGSYQLNFGTAPYGNQPTVVYLVLTNPTDVPVEFELQTPGDLQLQDVPLWHDEIPPWHRGTSQGGASTGDEPTVEEQRLMMAEHHYEWVENHKVLDVYPKTATIAPGEFQFVRFTYQHFSVGTHILPFVLTVLRGKSMVFYCKANTLPPNIGRLSVRANAITLRPVPIGYERGPLQVIELSNCGSAPAYWMLNQASINDLQAQNYGFPLLTIHPTSGNLDPKSRLFLHAYFTPIEAKPIRCPIKIDLTLRDGTVVETLDFELCATGFDPKKGEAPPEYLTPPFGPTLPLQTYAPLPNYGAALSCEAVDFGVVPVDSINTKVVALVNYSRDSVLSFQWHTQGLFRNMEEFSITPESGTLYPGTHQMILFRLHCIEGPLELVGDLECQISWELLHPPPPPGPDPWERPMIEEEVFAAHTDAVHEPTYDPHNFANRHVSVVNRLTVARFRALMSTAAGQKYLNRSLDRTALLSSHISNLTPRRAYKKLEQNFLRSREQETKTDDLDKENLGFSQVLSESFHSQGGHTASLPQTGESLASFPLFVRLSVACRAEESSDLAVALPREKHLVQAGGAVEASSPSQPARIGSMVIQGGDGEPQAALATSSSSSKPKEDFATVCDNIIEGMRVFLNGDSFKDFLAQQAAQPAPYFSQLDPTTGARPSVLEGLPELRVKQRTDPLVLPPPIDVVAGASGGSSSSSSSRPHEERGKAHSDADTGSRVSLPRSALLMDFPDKDLFAGVSRAEEMKLRPPLRGSSSPSAAGTKTSSSSFGGTGASEAAEVGGAAAASALLGASNTSDRSKANASSSSNTNTQRTRGGDVAVLQGGEEDQDRHEIEKDPVLRAEQYWADTLEQYGDIRLENFFTNCASHVLEHTVLKITDETISGKSNWAKLHIEKK